jgi:hypothetical protein
MGQQSYFVAQARTRRQLRGEDFFRYVPRVSWDEHLDGAMLDWAEGEHVAVIASSDHGKTHLVLRGLAPLWPTDYQWLTIDVKGDDPTLRGWGHPVKKLPARFTRRQFYGYDHDHGQRYRLVLPRHVPDLPAAQAVVKAALKTCRDEHRWVIHLNEVRALTDPQLPGLGLASWVANLWQRGRPHVTIIGETQRPAWVPRDMFDNSAHFYVGGNLDTESRRRLAQIGGDQDNLMRALRFLGDHEFVYVRRRDGLMQMVRAPE